MRNVSLSLLAIALFAATPAACSPHAAVDPCAPFDQAHTAWAELLEAFVEDGTVDYAGLSGSEVLDGYLASLESVCAEQYAGWTEAQQMAYWINAYNAYTVRLILNHYPLKSIRSIGLLPFAAFRRDFIPSPHLRGRDLSLDDVEHEILRKEFVEPRIHFAIVCASISCPPLRDTPFTADGLADQLQAAAQEFLADASYNRYDAGANTLYLSSIFDWFGEDFVRAQGSVVAYVRPFFADAGTTLADEPTVRFLDYDWSLNGR